MKKIPSTERELISSELVFLAERLVKQGFTIPETRRVLFEMLTVSV
jgi:hypothetical protein